MSVNDAKTSVSKRKHARYAVSDDCRLRASIMIRSSDAASASKDWPGTLVDLSATGAHIQISMAAVAYQGDSCVLKLSYGAVKAEIRGFLAHYVCSARYSVCGLSFDASFSTSNKEYQAFLKAVVASATLKAGEMTAEGGRYREEYRGPGFTKLVVWRDNKPERALVAFDYTMGRYCAILMEAGPDMLKNKGQVRFKAAPGAEGVDPDSPLSSVQEAEARWEFSVAASNLPKAIPPELRRFMRLVS